MNHVINATCPRGADASQIAAAAAAQAGTTLAGNMRWHGGEYPSYREIATADGRVVRVVDAWDDDDAHAWREEMAASHADAAAVACESDDGADMDSPAAWD